MFPPCCPVPVPTVPTSRRKVSTSCSGPCVPGSLRRVRSQRRRRSVWYVFSVACHAGGTPPAPTLVPYSHPAAPACSCHHHFHHPLTPGWGHPLTRLIHGPRHIHVPVMGDVPTLGTRHLFLGWHRRAALQKQVSAEPQCACVTSPLVSPVPLPTHDVSVGHGGRSPLATALAALVLVHLLQHLAHIGLRV